MHLSSDQRMRRWRHLRRKGMYVVLPEVPRRFLGCGVRMWSNSPNRSHRCVMDLSNLLEREQRCASCTSLSGLAIDPGRGIRVALDLEVFLQLFVAHGLAACEQRLDLLQDERVALDRRRVVRLVEPDIAPDLVCLGRPGQPTNSLERGHFCLEAFVNRGP